MLTWQLFHEPDESGTFESECCTCGECGERCFVITESLDGGSRGLVIGLIFRCRR